MQELNTSTIEYDFERLQTVVELLSSLHEGWKDAVQDYKREKAAEMTEDNMGLDRVSVGSIVTERKERKPWTD